MTRGSRVSDDLAPPLRVRLRGSLEVSAQYESGKSMSGWEDGVKLGLP
jgi:hypothetical protein